MNVNVNYSMVADFNVVLSEDRMEEIRLERERAMFTAGLNTLHQQGEGIMAQIRRANSQIYNHPLTPNDIKEMLEALDYKESSITLDRTNIPGLTKFKVSRDDR